MECEYYVQLDIYNTTVEEVQRKLGFFDILNDHGLDFKMVQYAYQPFVENSECDNDELLVALDEVRREQCNAVRNANVASCDILSTASSSLKKDSVHQQILESGIFDSDEIDKFNEVFHWIYSKQPSPNGHASADFSANRDRAASFEMTVSSLDNNNHAHNLTCSQHSTLNSSRGNENQMSRTMQDFIHSMDIVFNNYAGEEVKSGAYCSVLDKSDEHLDSVLSVVNKIVNSISQKESGNCAGTFDESVDTGMFISPDAHLDLTDKKERSFLSVNDGSDVSFHDASSVIGEVDEKSVSHDVKPYFIDFNHDQSAPNVNYILEGVREVNDAARFNTTSGLDDYDDNIEEFCDSRLSNSEAQCFTEQSLPLAIIDTNGSTSVTESIDLRADFLNNFLGGDSVLSVVNKILTSMDTDMFISRDAHPDITDVDERSFLSVNDENDVSFHDASSTIGEVDKKSVSQDVKPYSTDSNHDQSIPDVNYILEVMQRSADCSGLINNDSLWIENREPEIITNNQIDGDLSRSFTERDDSKSVRTVSSSFTMEMKDMKYNCEKLRKKKSRHFVTKRRIRRRLHCMFTGCCSVLSFRNTHNCWSRLFRHAESHAVVTCEHCDYKCKTQTMAAKHHKRKHSQFVFGRGQNKPISQLQLNSLMEVCFPGELERRK